jgi:hypothetical protein
MSLLRILGVLLFLGGMFSGCVGCATGGPMGGFMLFMLFGLPGALLHYLGNQAQEKKNVVVIYSHLPPPPTDKKNDNWNVGS